MSLLDNQLSFSQNSWDFSFPQGLNRKPMFCRGLRYWKTFHFILCVGILVVQKFQSFRFCVKFSDNWTHFSQSIQIYKLDSSQKHEGHIDSFLLVWEVWIQKVNDFVARIWFFIVRNCQKTAVNCDNFPIFQTTFLPNWWLPFWLQFLNPKHFVFGRFINLSLTVMFVDLEYWLSRKAQILLLFTKFYVQTYLFSGLNSSTKVAVDTILLVKVYWLKKTINFFSASEPWWTQNARIVRDTDFFWFSNSRFSETTDLISSFKVSK